jgi:exonuclease III
LPYTFDDEWIWKRNTKIGMWNVRSLFWSSALNMLHNVLSNLDFDILVLQETLLESGIQKFDKFSSGSESKKHEFGCRFYVRGEFYKYVEDFKIKNERISCLRLKAKWFSCTLINIHSPTNEKTEEIKEEFNNLLEHKYKSNT